MKKNILNISVVLYKTPKNEILKLFPLLKEADFINKIYIIDNYPTQGLREFCIAKKLVYIKTMKNIGYGSAHNIALKHSYFFDKNIRYHLIINSDIDLSIMNLKKIILFMNRHKKIGLLSPRIVNTDSTEQLIFKNYPNLLNTLLNRFYKSRSYLINIDLNKKFTYAPVISGCFMLLRLELSSEKFYFDKRFFMYMEDIDFCRQLAGKAIIGVYNNISIRHSYKQLSRVNFKLFIIHCISILKYHLKWGFIDSAKNIFNSTQINKNENF